jgi:hypothetical protein
MTIDSNNVLLPEQTLIDTNICKPVPVALIANPFAHKFSYASQMGSYNLQGNDWNPLNPFCRYMPPGPFSFADPYTSYSAECSPVALVVLNSLTRPLALTDFWSQFNFAGIGQHQIAFPAVYDPTTTSDFTDVTKVLGVNRIPGVRPYPRSSAHRNADGSPAMMGGLGVFGFAVEEPFGQDGVDRPAGGACSFSYTQDSNGNFIGPFIGVAFWTNRIWASPGAFQNSVPFLDSVHSAVTIDVVGKHGDLPTFYKNAMQNYYESASDALSTTAWCQPEPMGPVNTCQRLVPSPWIGPTLSVSLHDCSSTLG